MDFNSTDLNSTLSIAPFVGDGVSIDTSLPPVFHTGTEYAYYTFVLWRLCELVQQATWALGYRRMSGNIRPLCFTFLHAPLSEPFRSGNQLPDRSPLTIDVLPSSLPFETNGRKNDFLELAAQSPCHRFVDDMDNAFYESRPLRRLQKTTRDIGLGPLHHECTWQTVLFVASIFSNATLLGKLEPFATRNSTKSTKVPSPTKAYKIAAQLLKAVQKIKNITVNEIKEDDFRPSADCAPGKEKVRLWGFQVILSGKSNFWLITNQTDVQTLYRFCKESLTKGVFFATRSEKRNLELIVRYLKHNSFPQTPTLCQPEDLSALTTKPSKGNTTTTKSPQRRDLEGLEQPKVVTHQFNQQKVSTPKPHELYGQAYMRGTTVRRQHNLSQPRPGHR